MTPMPTRSPLFRHGRMIARAIAAWRQHSRTALAVAVEIAACAIIAYGVWLWWPPGGYIVAGVLGLFLAQGIGGN